RHAVRSACAPSASTNELCVDAEPASAAGGKSGRSTFVKKEIMVQERTSVRMSKSVEAPSSRENADAEPIPPMNAIGVTQARNRPDTGPLAQAGHITANPRRGPGRALAPR